MLKWFVRSLLMAACRVDLHRSRIPSLGELRDSLREIFLQSDDNQDVVDAEYEGTFRRHEKWSTKDHHETNRRRQRQLSECPPNDR